MSNTAKVSISVPDEELLKWAKKRSERTGVSLSALFTEALRFERQMEARRAFLAEMGPAGVPTPEEAAAIRAELGLDTELGLGTVSVLTEDGEQGERKAARSEGKATYKRKGHIARAARAAGPKRSKAGAGAKR